MNRASLALACAFCGILAAQDGTQQFAKLGDIRLQSGASIQDCRLGYRTFGRLNAAKSNAVLFPAWFGGTTADLAGLIGPGKLVDSTRWFVVAIDPLGNGVSSSPSNSTAQPRLKFPRFTVRDMVQTEHRLAEMLGLRHVRAVLGISMGGMQTFEWMVAYPDFMDRAIPIVGSPRLTSYDLLLWSAEKHAIETDGAWRHGDYAEPPRAALDTVAEIHQLALTTPDYRARQTPRAEYGKFVKESERKMDHVDANNWYRQLEAMMAHDVSLRYSGDMRRAAAAVKARVLIVVGVQDHMVNPLPALEFARLARANTLELDSDCGHLANSCEAAALNPAVARFLE